MDIDDSDPDVSAPSFRPRGVSDRSTDSGYYSLSDRVAATDSRSVLEQADSGHSTQPDILDATKSKRVRKHPGIYLTRAQKPRSHSITHTNERPFACTICGKAFARLHDRIRHEGLHNRERLFVCRGELSAQPAGAWGCDRRFARPDSLARHFLSPSGRICIRPLLDEEAGEPGTVFLPSTLPSVLLAQYPAFQNLDWAQMLTQAAGKDCGMSSLDSGDGSALRVDPCKLVPLPPVQLEAETGGLRTTLSHDGSLVSLEDQAIPSQPLPKLQDQTDFFTLEPDSSETSLELYKNNAENNPVGEQIVEVCARSHDSDEISRLPDSRAYTPDSAVNVSISMKGANSVPNRHSAALTKASPILEWLTASRHPVEEDEEHCGSSTSAHDQPRIDLAREQSSVKGDDGQLSDEYERSLSPNKSSAKSGSENEYDSTSEGSVLNCSHRALILRLMDEICSSFYFQVNYRPRQRGQDGQGAQMSSSDSTERTNTTDHFNGGSSVGRRKRINKDDEDPEDKDDGKHKRLRTQDFYDGLLTRVRYFACPFHKFDASTYGNGNEDPRLGLKYRSCGPPGWPTIGKLK